jgi:DNA-binding CsgD family transcriptional regulator
MLQGRDVERRRLDLLLGRARAGTGGVLVLRGEPGIGKTALLGYAAGSAGSMRVLRAAGIEAETELAFAGLYSLLHPLAGYLGALPERHAAALRAAFGLSHDQAPPERFAVAAGTHGLLTAAAEHGALLILVDDLHWLDPNSSEALTFALRRLGCDAIACVLTLREGVPVPAGLPSCDLAGLGREQAAQLVEAVAGIRPAPAVARRLHAETGGNPLALAELSAALTAEQLGGAEMPQMPQMPLQPGAAIRQRFAARLDQLSPPARTALLVAAAAGRCAAAEVAAAAGLVGSGDSQALGEAEAAGLVHITAEGVQFSHPLLRSAAYHGAAPALRRAAHRALAQVVTGRDAERAAWHRAAAATGPDDGAAAALEAAARLAARKGAPLAAAAAWERAAGLSGAAERRSARLAEAAEAALDGGDLDRARCLTETMAAAGQPGDRARMLAVKGRLELLTGRPAAAQRTLQEAADLLADADPRLAVELLTESVYWTVEAGLFDVASRVTGRITDLAERSDETARFLADYSTAFLGWRRGDADHGMPRLRRAAARLNADRVLASSPELQPFVSWTLSALGYEDRARRHCDQAMELVRSQGAVGRLPDLLTMAVSLDLQAGRWSLALANGSQALDLALATGQTPMAYEALFMLAEIEAAQGRDEDCLRHARQADQLATQLGLPLGQLRARLTVAALELGRGRLEEAIAHYEEVGRLAAEWGYSDAFTSPVPYLIEAHARAGAVDRARALLPDYLDLVTGVAHPLWSAVAARCRGIVAAGDFDGYFLDAIRLHQRSSGPFQHARTHLCYGERLRRARRRRDARGQFRAAVEIFDRLDARPWADRARAELRATGETMTSGGNDGAQLTPQELQIALLVAQGRTNAEVGQAVFLSTRTVEFHLSRAYRKLGVASRTELTRRLASAGTVPG